MSKHTLNPKPFLATKSFLAPKSFLDDFQHRFGDTELRECTGMDIVSLAIPLGGKPALEQAIQSRLNCTLPEVTRTSVSNDGVYQFLRLGDDQLLVLIAHDPASHSDLYAEKTLSDLLDKTAYSTLQSDNWVVLEINGTLACPALERICQLDLHPDVFPNGGLGRTVMEHMNAIIVRLDQHHFLLLSASSSAKSFRHAVETSIKNIL